MTEKFDYLADCVARGVGIMCADVAGAARGDALVFNKIEAWLASKGYHPVVIAGKVTYLKTQKWRGSR